MSVCMCGLYHSYSRDTKATATVTCFAHTCTLSSSPQLRDPAEYERDVFRQQVLLLECRLLRLLQRCLPACPHAHIRSGVTLQRDSSGNSSQSPMHNCAPRLECAKGRHTRMSPCVYLLDTRSAINNTERSR
ncbi:unnamed protein product, partial [Ectocarpus sp. 12 AP-2014]